MVRDAKKRKAKYEAKVDGPTLARQTSALKPGMVKAASAYFDEIAGLEYGVKRIVEEAGVSTLRVRDYLNFAREMYSLRSKFSGPTMNAEAQLKVNKWAGRGLDGSLLIRIAELQGVDPSLPDGGVTVVDVSDRVARALGAVANLLNPHPVSLSTLLNPHPVSLASLPNVTLGTDNTGIVKQATTPAMFNVTLTLVATEYNQALPANTKKFLVQCRDGTEFRLAFETGKVATSVTPFLTVRANCIYWEDYVSTSATVYVAGTAGKVVEIVAWT
jgi:hypothetical protein